MKHYLILIRKIILVLAELFPVFVLLIVGNNLSCNCFVQRIHESVRSDFTRYSAGRKNDGRAEILLEIEFDTRAE